MVYLTSTLLASLLASTALAAPKMLQNRHRHHHYRALDITGTGGPVPTDAGPYDMGNSTAVGPTGTGTAPVVVVTVTVIPVAPSNPPASTNIAANANTPADVELTGIATPANVEDADAKPVQPEACGAVRTVTMQTMVTVTVDAAKEDSTTTSTMYSTTTVVKTLIAPLVPSSTGTASLASNSTSNSTAPIVAGGKVLLQHYSSSTFTTAAAAVTNAQASSPSPLPTAHAAAAVVNPVPVENFPVSTPVKNPPASSSVPAAHVSSIVPANLVAAAATSPVPASTLTPATPATPASGTVKRGLVYNDASLCAPFTATTGKFGWGYNWDSSSSGLSSSLSFVPMLWGADANHVSHFATAAKVAIGAGADAIMAFNEPDMIRSYGGSQLDPATAAATFKTHIQPHGSASVRLGSPAVTNADQQSPPMGLPWLCQFAAACQGCSLDFITLHWYGWESGTAKEQADAFKTYITNANAQLPSCVGAAKPIWVTEFAAKPLSDQTLNAEFLSLVLPFLDAEPAVERYSYFMVSEDSLVSKGALSQIGKAYVA